MVYLFEQDPPLFEKTMYMSIYTTFIDIKIIFGCMGHFTLYETILNIIVCTVYVDIYFIMGLGNLENAFVK